MKYLFLLLSLPLFFLSCNKDDFSPERNPDLVGTWKVTEQYIDPGDGSGNFEDVEFDQTFQFRADGTISSNRNMCSPLNGGGPVVESFGTYDITEGTIEPNNCHFNPFHRFELDGPELEIFYLCDEGCVSRLRKLRR